MPYFLEKVKRNKKDKSKRRPSFYKQIFVQTLPFIFRFRNTLFLIMQLNWITKEQIQNGRHFSGKRNLGSNLNPKKYHHSTSWNKTFCANVHILVNFISSKNEDFSIRIIEVLFGKSQLRVKKQCFQNKRASNLETLWYLNCGIEELWKLSNLSPKYWKSFYRKSRTW